MSFVGRDENVVREMVNALPPSDERWAIAERLYDAAVAAGMVPPGHAQRVERRAERRSELLDIVEGRMAEIADQLEAVDPSEPLAPMAHDVAHMLRDSIDG